MDGLALYPVPYIPCPSLISHVLSILQLYLSFTIMVSPKEIMLTSRSSRWPKQNTWRFLSGRTYSTHKSIFSAHQSEASLTNVHRISSHLNCPSGWNTTWQMSSTDRWTSSSRSCSRWNTASYVSDPYNPNQKNMGCLCLHSRTSCWRLSRRFSHANSHCNLFHCRAWPQQTNSGPE